MAVVRQTVFDSAVVDTYSVDGDALGVRGLELIITQNNGARFVINGTTGAANGAYCVGQNSSTGAFGRVYVAVPIVGNPIRVQFLDAVTHRGRIIYYDEPIGPFGRVPFFANSVAVPAATLGAGIMAARYCGRARRMMIYLQTSRAGRLEAILSYGGITPTQSSLITIAGVTGGFAQFELLAVPDEIEFLGNNDDAAIVNTFQLAVVLEL